MCFRELGTSIYVGIDFFCSFAIIEIIAGSQSAFEKVLQNIGIAFFCSFASIEIIADSQSALEKVLHKLRLTL